MSFLKNIFQCCNSSQTKTDFSMDSPKQFQTISTNYTINQPTLIMKNSLKKVSLLSSKSLRSPNEKYNLSITCDPNYIPLNQYEISPISLDDAKKIELSDVIGDLLYGEKVEITYKGIQTTKINTVSFDNIEVDIIRSINYFWIRTQQTKYLLADNDNGIPKDYVLNFLCDYFSDLSKKYLFMICYIKKLNQYKIKFNNEFDSLLSNNVSISIPSEHSVLLPKVTLLHIGSQQIKLTLLSKSMLEIEIKKKKKHVYHSIVNRMITIGKSENSTISFPKDNKLSEMNTTIYYDFENQGWRIQDGYKSFPSYKGTWIFSSFPVLIEDGMHVKFWNKEFAISCK